MKKYLLCFCVLLSIGLQAQIQQHINKPSGPVSNAISEIDSIRFNAGNEEMQVILVDGNTVVHQLGDIDNVTFITLSGPGNHSCGAPEVHNTVLNYGNLTDQEGNLYKTIVIGTQEWMAENLNTSVYQNGDTIVNVIEGSEWNTLTTGAWCFYNNDSQYDCPYGKLYNWHAVNDSRNVCPAGWHVPSDDEWNILVGYIDPAYNPSISGEQSPFVGKELKSLGMSYWMGLNIASTNDRGFSALPGAYRSFSGLFNDIESTGIWWSSTPVDSTDAWYRLLSHTSDGIQRDDGESRNGLAVRCVRD